MALSVVSGDLLFGRYVSSAGTIDFATQYQKYTLKSEAEMLDSSAGSNQYRTFVAGRKKWTVSLNGLFAGTGTPMGTADLKNLREGTSGTIYLAPLGTATGQRRIYGAALVQSRQLDFDFDKLSEWSLELQGSDILNEDLY